MKEWYAKKAKELYQRYQDAIESGNLALAQALFKEYERYDVESKR